MKIQKVISVLRKMNHMVEFSKIKAWYKCLHVYVILFFIFRKLSIHINELNLFSRKFAINRKDPIFKQYTMENIGSRKCRTFTNNNSGTDRNGRKTSKSISRIRKWTIFEKRPRNENNRRNVSILKIYSFDFYCSKI